MGPATQTAAALNPGGLPSPPPMRAASPRSSATAPSSRIRPATARPYRCNLRHDLGLATPAEVLKLGTTSAEEPDFWCPTEGLRAAAGAEGHLSRRRPNRCSVLPSYPAAQPKREGPPAPDEESNALAAAHSGCQHQVSRLPTTGLWHSQRQGLHRGVKERKKRAG